jgi:type IV secretory pathway ATPase VirB11/archaellum biosynthesis ATPase
MNNMPNKLYFQSSDGSLISPNEAKVGFAVKTTLTGLDARGNVVVLGTTAEGKSTAPDHDGDRK